MKQIIDEKPVWLDSLKHPAYPDSLFILGVGMSKLSGDLVKDRSLSDANAFGEIAKQIETRVKVKFVQITTERTISGKSLDITNIDSTLSVSEVYSDLALQGLSIAKRYIDRRNGVMYSLALLERRKAALVLKNEIEILRSYHEDCIEQADNLLDQHRFLRALWYTKEAEVTYNLGTERVAFARFLTAPVNLRDSEWLKSFGSPVASLNKVEEILSGLVLEKKSGDNQRFSMGSSPREPLTVSLSFIRDEDSFPIDGALVHFSFSKGNGILADSVYTDQNGIAQSTIYQMEPSTQPVSEISATVDLIPVLGNLKDLPDAWLELARSFEKSVVFKIVCEIENIENKAQFLAMSLAESLPDGYESPLRLAISNLTYQDLRISSPFLRYFQEQLSMHLNKLTQFQVIKEKELQQAIRTRSIAVTQKKIPNTIEGIKEFIDADAVLVGKCWEKGDSLLSMIVEIVESSSKAALSSSSVLIHKGQIPSNLPLLPSNYQEIQQNLTVYKDVSSANSKLEVKLWVDRLDGGVYEEGEKIKAYVWTNKECYLYMIYHNVADKDILIFPNSYRQSNRLNGNTVYEIPGKSDRFDFTVVQPCGVEILKVFASTNPMPELQGEIVSSGIKRLKLSTSKLAATLRGVKIEEESGTDLSGIDYNSLIDPFERAEASCVVTTVRK